MLFTQNLMDEWSWMRPTVLYCSNNIIRKLPGHQSRCHLFPHAKIQISNQIGYPKAFSTPRIDEQSWMRLRINDFIRKFWSPNPRLLNPAELKPFSFGQWSCAAWAGCDCSHEPFARPSGGELSDWRTIRDAIFFCEFGIQFSAERILGRDWRILEEIQEYCFRDVIRIVV